MKGSRGRRALLRRLLRAPGAAPNPTAAAIPGSKARVPAVATLLVLAVLCCVSTARADDAPPPTPPASTTPDAPPPDPYSPPTSSTKPKQTRPTVAHSTPVYHAPVRSYTPPATPVGGQAVQSLPTSRPRPAKVVHKRKAVGRHVAPKPVKVRFTPFANVVAASNLPLATSDDRDRTRYLWLAGFAFAVLAAAGLSLHVLSVRMVT